MLPILITSYSLTPHSIFNLSLVFDSSLWWILLLWRFKSFLCLYFLWHNSHPKLWNECTSFVCLFKCINFFPHIVHTSFIWLLLFSWIFICLLKWLFWYVLYWQRWHLWSVLMFLTFVSNSSFGWIFFMWFFKFCLYLHFLLHNLQAKIWCECISFMCLFKLLNFFPHILHTSVFLSAFLSKCFASTCLLKWFLWLVLYSQWVHSCFVGCFWSMCNFKSM